MIATAESCPSIETCRHFLEGELADPDFERVSDHIEQCGPCRDAIESLSREAPARLALAEGAHADIDTACQIAIGRLLGDRRRFTFFSPEISRQLGPYEILGPLGRGGMGTVCLARHQRLQRLCAIKFLPQLRAGEPDWLERFDREMITVAALEHPHIVRATDAGHEDGWHFLVMEYLEGHDVGRIAHFLHRLNVADACAIVRQAALGLAHIHANALVHRDIKPSNLMLCDDGTVKLLDLGLVLDGEATSVSDDRLTTVGHLMGTIAYMAPEQLLDSSQVAPAADVYALGATLYRLLVGTVPHATTSGLAARILAVTQQPAPSLAKLRPDLDAKLGELVDAMLARDPRRRPRAQQVAESLADLSSASDLSSLVRQIPDSDIESQPAPPASKVAGPHAPAVAGAGNRGRRWWRWVAAGGFAAALILAGIVFVLQTEKGELVIRSEVANAKVLVKRGDTLVERLSIERIGQHRFQLRQGSYTVEIEGAEGGLRLSNNQVTIASHRPTELGVAPVSADEQGASSSDSDEQRVFQGKSLDAWLSILSREQDVEALCHAMEAVEVLSRGTSRRGEAARRTNLLTEVYGGFQSRGRSRGLFNSRPASSGDPSPYFMGCYLEIFRQYLPSPGLALVAQDLRQGNDNSRFAALFVLNNYLSGVQDESEIPGLRQRAYTYLALPTQRHNVGALIHGLEETIFALNIQNDNGAVSQIAWNVAVMLRVRLAHIVGLELDLSENPRLTAAIRRKVSEAQQAYRTTWNETEGQAQGYASWAVSYGLLLEALKLYEAGRMELDPQFAAARVTTTLGGLDQWVDQQRAELFRQLLTASPPKFRNALDKELAEVIKSVGNKIGIMRPEAGGGSAPHTLRGTVSIGYSLENSPEYWKEVFLRIADMDPAEDFPFASLQNLEELEQYMAPQTLAAYHEAMRRRAPLQIEQD